MWRKFFLKFVLVAALLGVCSLRATSIITTAPGGASSNGYQGSNASMTSGDVIRGFVMFKNGFTIPSGGTLFYDADGPVYGNVTFGNSSSVLQLGSDLRLGGTGSLWSGLTSKIAGYGNSIYLGGDVTLSSHVATVSNNLIIDGCGHSMTLADTSYFAMDSNVTLTLKNMNLVIPSSFSGTYPLRATGATNFKVYLQDVNIYLAANVGLFGSGIYGTTVIQGLVSVSGPYAVSANGMQTASGNGVDCNIFINANSTLYFGPGTTLNLDNLNVDKAKKIGMFDATSRLVLDGCTLTWRAQGSVETTSDALQLQRGSVFFDDKVVIKNFANDGATANTAVTRGLIFGDGSSSANDVDVRVLGGAYVVLQGCMQYKHS